jgi:hypothetical protein
MRFGVVVLIALSCVACARFEKPVAEASAPQPAAAADKQAPVSDAAPARFECSDGTISISQEACLVNMARARLPPSQPGGRLPPNPGSAAADMPTGSVH